MLATWKQGRSKNLLSLPIHLAHHRFAAAAVAQLSLRCRSAVSPAVAPAVAPAVTPLSLLLLLRCRLCRFVAAYVAPAVSTLSHSCCRSDVAPVLLRYRSVISPLSLRCWSAAAAVTPDVALLSPLLLLLLWLLLSLGLFAVVASRVRIRVTVDIGDYQAHVSSCL